MREFHIQVATNGSIGFGDNPTDWLVQGSQPFSATQISSAELSASTTQLSVEAKNDLRTLAATGASSHTRRTITAVTAGALGFLGALLGVLGGYIGMIGWLRTNSLNGGIAALENIPVADLLLILVGMPAFAAIVGWFFAGREPAGMAHQAIE
jgi:putative ABC transport system permease protein